MEPIEEAIVLLQTLWCCSSWGELRLLKGSEVLKPLFLKLPLTPKNLNPALQWAYRKNQENYNVYFGVFPRINPRGRNVDVEKYSALIADLDNIDKSWPYVKKLQDAGCPASICVRTPRGLHLYWLLKECESTEGPARLRMQRLQKAIFSDAVHDPARILRLPGAKCNKSGNDNLVHLAWFNPTVRYTSEEIDSYVSKLWPEVVIAEPPKASTLVPVNFLTQPMSNDVWASYAGSAPKGTRSPLCLSFIQHTLMLGWTPETIFDVIQTIPIGGHYLDRGPSSAMVAFDHDLKKAKFNVTKCFNASIRVVVNRVSIYENAPIGDGFPGIKKLKIDFIESTRSGYGNTFREWVTIPDEWRPDKARWNALLSAVGLSVSDKNPVENLLEQLPGKYLRVDFRDDSVNKIRYFLPDVVMQNA